MNEHTRTAPPEVTGTFAPGDVTRAAPDTARPELPAGVVSPPGYDLLDEAGRGGMGVVYRAWDRAMNREVAVKVLAERYSPDSATARRFVEEARITGRLAHPGIPAVHQVGTLPDGRPFLAMKLIRGQTLNTLLKEQGAGAAKWVGVFEGICQAVGYAHANGVIHRDLKPANVMVGSFGEVQVMDWGLAKLLASRECERPEAKAPVAHAPGSPTLDRTVAGSVMGTPAYMAPEQAGGLVDQTDERSDVFGLGAVLCTLLTGSPPYSGTSAESIRRQAIRGEMAEALARLDECGTDPELVTLCKRCLAVAQADRPANAGELAAAVADFRRTSEERARQAELDQAKAAVTAAERRKRWRVLLALAASILTGFGLWWWRESDRNLRREQTTRTVEVALARAEEIRKQLPPGQSVKLSSAEADLATAKQAVAAVEQAEAALLAGIPSDELMERVRVAKDKLLERVELADKRVVVARLEATFLEKLPEVRSTPVMELAEAGKKKSDLYRDLFLGLEIDIVSGDMDRVCDQIFHLHLARQQAQVALYDWRMNHTQLETDEPVRKRLSAILDRMDQDPWRVRFRRVVRAADPKAFAELLQEADEARLPADSYLLLYWADKNVMTYYGRGTAKETTATRIRLLERAQLLYPDNPIVHEALGDLHHLEAGPPTPAGKLAAVTNYRAALSLRPKSDALRVKLWRALTDFDPAEGIAWVKLNLKDDPTSATWTERLAESLTVGGHHAAALVNLRRAIQLEPTAPRYARLCWVLVNSMKGDEALAVARECQNRMNSDVSRMLLIKILESQRKDTSAEYLAILREDLRAAVSQSEQHDATRRLAEAFQRRSEFDEAIGVWERLVEKYPKEWEIRRDLAGYLEKTKDAATVAEAYRATLAVMADEPTEYVKLAENVFTDPFTLTPYRYFVLNEGRKAHPNWLTDVGGFRRKLADYACEAAATTHRHAPTADEKLKLWRSALGWMRDELGGQLDAAGKPERWPEVRRTVAEWLNDYNPTGVRKLTTSNKLPESERKDWADFWADVRKLRTLLAPPSEMLPPPRPER